MSAFYSALVMPHGNVAGVPLSMLNLMVVLLALTVSYTLARRAKRLSVHPRLVAHLGERYRTWLAHGMFAVVMLFGVMLTLQLIGFTLTDPIWPGWELTPFRLASVAACLVLVVFGSRILGRIVSYRLSLGGVLDRREQVRVGHMLHAVLLIFGVLTCLHSLHLPVMQPFATLGTSSISVFSLSVLATCAMAVLVGSQIGARLMQYQFLSSTPLDEGARYAIGRITYYCLVIVGLLTAFQTVGLQLGSVTVLIGALGVGVGLGLQSMVSNFVSGLVILLERPIQAGDYVEVARGKGRVRTIGARSTTIVTPDNTVVIVPNADLTSSQIINWTHRDALVRTRIRILVDGNCDLDQVAGLMLAAAEHPHVAREPAPQFSLAEFADTGLRVELAFSVDIRHATQSSVRNQLNLAIWRSFQEAGIALPFPRNEVYWMGSPEEGYANTRPE